MIESCGQQERQARGCEGVENRPIAPSSVTAGRGRRSTPMPANDQPAASALTPTLPQEQVRHLAPVHEAHRAMRAICGFCLERDSALT